MNFCRELRFGIALFALVGLAVPAAAESGGEPVDPSAESTEPELSSPQAGGRCQVKNAVFKTASERVDRTSTTFEVMPGMEAKIKIRGNGRNCLLVRISAEAGAPGDHSLLVRAVLDDTVVALPGDVRFTRDSDEDNDGSWARAHSFEFVFPKVSPGKHRVKILWSSSTGDSVSVFDRTLSVLHK